MVGGSSPNRFLHEDHSGCSIIHRNRIWPYGWRHSTGLLTSQGYPNPPSLFYFFSQFFPHFVPILPLLSLRSPFRNPGTNHALFYCCRRPGGGQKHYKNIGKKNSARWNTSLAELKAKKEEEGVQVAKIKFLQAITD